MLGRDIGWVYLPPVPFVYIVMGSWKGRGIQDIQLVKVLL